MKSANILKIVVLIGIFFGVVYMIRLLKSPDVVSATTTPNPNSALGILLGAPDVRPFNWCEEFTGPVQIYPADMNSKALPKKLGNKERARICTGIMEPASLEDAQGEYRPVAEVLEEKGAGPVLEQNAQGVFRTKGLPFRSKALEKVVTELR